MDLQPKLLLPIQQTSLIATGTLTAATTYSSSSIKSGTCEQLILATITVDPASVGGSIAEVTTVWPGTNSTTLTVSGHTGTVVCQESSTDICN
jgi:hypothetical protein